MSFSFLLTAKDKSAAKVAVAKRLAEVVMQQPVHAVDTTLIANATNAHIDLCEEPGDGQCVHVQISGSVGGDIDWTLGEVRKLTSVNLGISAYIAAIPEQRA